MLLLNLLVNDVNTVLEIEGEDDELRDSMGDIDNFAENELEDDNRLLPLVEVDIVLVLDTALDKDGRVVAESCTDNVWVPLILEVWEFIPDKELVREYVGDIVLVIDTRALLDDTIVVDGDDDIDMEEDVVRLPLTHAETVFVAVVIRLKDDFIVGVITAVLRADEEGEIVIIPVTVMGEEMEGVNVFCKDEVTDTEPV